VLAIDPGMHTAVMRGAAVDAKGRWAVTGSHGAAFAPDGRLATTALDGKVRLYAGDLKGDVRPTTIWTTASRNRSRKLQAMTLSRERWFNSQPAKCPVNP
jgi:hypothetical protein